MKKRIIATVAGVALCARRLRVWHVYGARSVPTAQTPAPAVPVVAEKLQASDVPIVMTGIGSVVAYNVVDVHAQVTGTIEQIGLSRARSCTRTALSRSSISVRFRRHSSRRKPTWRAIRQTWPTQGSILGASLRC